MPAKNKKRCRASVGYRLKYKWENDNYMSPEDIEMAISDYDGNAFCVECFRPIISYEDIVAYFNFDGHCGSCMHHYTIE